jgi:tRNA pseudouridine38-40 synthase
LAVGEQRRTPQWCHELLSAAERSSDFAAAPAQGLTLVGVDYPPDDELASRILITRDLRTR